jgi:hypothetical protein
MDPRGGDRHVPTGHGVGAVDFQHILRSVLFNYVTDLQILSD